MRCLQGAVPECPGRFLLLPLLLPPPKTIKLSPSLHVNDNKTINNNNNNKVSNCHFWQFIEKCSSCPSNLLLSKANALWFSWASHPASELDGSLCAEPFICDKLGKLPW